MTQFTAAFILLAVVVAAVPSDDHVPETHQLPAADAAPETELYAQLHKEASMDIASLIEAGKSKDACSSLASSTIKEIKDGATNSQKILNKMNTGKNCHKAGLTGYNIAKKAESQARTQYNSARRASTKAANKPVKFSPFTATKVKTNGCLDVSKDPAYISAKKAASAAAKKSLLAQGKYDNSRKATSDALKAHQKAKKDCACTAQANHKKAIKAAARSNSAENAKAWKKAYLMKCVLKGTSVSKCKVPSVPKITVPRMPSWVARTRCSKSTSASARRVVAPKPKPRPKRPRPSKRGATSRFLDFRIFTGIKNNAGSKMRPILTLTDSKGKTFKKKISVSRKKGGMYMYRWKLGGRSGPPLSFGKIVKAHLKATSTDGWLIRRIRFKYSDSKGRFQDFVRVTVKNMTMKRPSGDADFWLDAKPYDCKKDKLLTRCKSASYGKLPHGDDVTLKPGKYVLRRSSGGRRRRSRGGRRCRQKMISIKGKPTFQSSEGWGGRPSRAVDGNTNGNYKMKTCTHTKKTRGAWWKVDLQKYYKVSRVSLYNRADCCTSRLNKVEVKVGNSRCGVLNKAKRHNSIKCRPGPKNGRTVMVKQLKSDFLTLCEVQVMAIVCSRGGRRKRRAPTRRLYMTLWTGGMPNAESKMRPRLTLTDSKGKTYKTTIHFRSKKNSGTTFKVRGGPPLSFGKIVKVHLTATSTDGWLMRGMRLFYRDRKSRVENGGSRKLVNTWFGRGPFWLDAKPYDKSASYGKFPHMDSVTLKPVTRRVAFGIGGRPRPLRAVLLNLKGKPTRQSSEGWSGKPSRAVDGNTNGRYGAKSCTHTQKRGHPWWRVDLQKKYKVSRVQLWNRTDCCTSRLNKVAVQVDGRRCGTIWKARRANTVGCGNRSGRTVWVKQLKSDYLTLCEVRVYVLKGTSTSTRPRKSSPSPPKSTSGPWMNGYWGVNKHDTIYAGSNGKWKRIPGKLKQIAFSGSRVWGVNRNDQIFTRNGIGGNSNWQHVSGRLKQVSVSGNRVWGVNKDDTIFTRPGTGGVWKHIPGKLKQIACSKNGNLVWGVNRNDDIFTRPGVGGSWKHISGKLKQIAVSGNTVWGVNRNDDIFTRPGVGGSWKHIGGKLKQIAVIGNTVWGINKSNRVYTRPGVGGRWKHIKHQTVLPSLAGGAPSVKSRSVKSGPRRHAACPATFPYALQWKNSGSYWCYQRPDGNKGRGGVCRYLGSMRAPNRGKWGLNQKPCPQRDPRGGCYKDNTNGKRDLPVYKGHKSQAACAASCKGFKYFGRQWTSECRCGNSYGKQGKATGCKCSASNIGPNKNCVYAVPKPKPVKKTCHTSGINGFSDYAWDPRGRYCYKVRFGSGVQQDWSRNKSRCNSRQFRSNVYIGKYSGNSHVYPNGDSRGCPGGKRRKVTITVKQDPRVSGTSAKVTEPRTCEYALVITRKSCPRRL